MEIKSIKSVKPNRHLFKKIIAILLSLTIIIISYIIITKANEEASDTVKVIRIKSSEGFNSDTILTDEDIETYNLIRKEFDEAMIEVDEEYNILGQYSIYYLRGNTILYEDMFTQEKPLQNEWLYELDEDHEVLTLPYNYLECGGDILMPGDRVRIRVSYEDEEVDLNSARSVKEVTKVEVLFDSIIIKDMLNSNSHSIYEVYKEVMKLSESKKQQVMKSEEFLSNIQPKALLLEGDKDQIEQYAKYKGISDNTLLITILSRDKSEAIIDQLPTLEKEVESWIEEVTER